MLRGRLAPAVLALLAAAGAALGWRFLPPPLLFGLLVAGGGHVANAAIDPAGSSWAARGPARLILDLAASLWLLAAAVLPLAVFGLGLGAARWSLSVVYGLVAALALARACPGGGRQPPVVGWLWCLPAIAALLPAVAYYAGGTVDDWWDLAFARAYAQRPAFSFAEPILGTGRVHPRFIWNPWLVAQALVQALGHLPDPAAFQASVVAPITCLLVIAGWAAMSEALVAPVEGRAARLAILLLPAWLWGTEALPFFTRLHQDKFVAGLALVPAMLAAAAACLDGRRRSDFVAFALLAGATMQVHGLVFAIAVLGAVLIAVGYSASGRFPSRSRAVAVTLGLLAVVPAWQAREVGRWFAREGISLAAPDNPVVRAHLALGRLLWPDRFYYVVNPAAVFGPVALLALPALVYLVRQHQRQARALVALSLAPCAILFVPGLAAMAGSVLVPWMLYRVGWLVPVPLLLGVSASRACAVRRPYARAAVAALAFGIALTAGNTGMDRFRREMQPHPGRLEKFPVGVSRRIYDALRERRETGLVLAPPGISRLVPALSGKPVVASSERATLVFAGDELEAYRRLRDRAAFFSRRTTPAERAEIAARYGVGLIVLRRHLLDRSSERAWLRAGSAAAVDAWKRHGRMPTAFARREDLEFLLPRGWPVVVEDEDFFIVATPRALARAQGGFGPEQGQAGRGWLAAFLVDQKRAAAPRGELLASAVGYPGAIFRFDPAPATLATPHGVVWTSGGRLWLDGPPEVTVAVELPTACPLSALELVPWLRTGRREVWEISVSGRVERLAARDREPVVIALGDRSRQRLTVRVRSLLGLPFGFEDIRVWGRSKECAGPWRPLMHPRWPAAELSVAALLELERAFGWLPKASVLLARRLEESGRTGDAQAILEAVTAREDATAAAWVERGLLADASGDFSDAERSYREALKVDSNNAWARACLAWAQMRRGWVPLGWWHALVALRLEPRYADAYTIAAIGARKWGLQGLAQKWLDRAISLDPRRGWAVMEKAKLLAARGERRRAVELLVDYGKRVPDDRAAARLAFRLARAGQP
ncbi:MAG: hypothetical protein D6815_06895 [Candidatus Dadabacteria bacterium]|nr:MAG: hypothetical protein D6815_06895 [Candidatus Dadabacteria bacterium]